MARVARPWAMFAAGVQPNDEREVPDTTIQAGPEMPNPHDDYGFRVSKQVSRQLHNLYEKLHYGDFKPPEYGIDWHSLYAFNSSARSRGPPEGSIDVALGLFRQARSQAPVDLVQQESASSKEATDILDMIIDACYQKPFADFWIDKLCRFAKRYMKAKKLRKVSHTFPNRKTKAWSGDGERPLNLHAIGSIFLESNWLLQRLNTQIICRLALSHMHATYYWLWLILSDRASKIAARKERRPRRALAVSLTSQPYSFSRGRLMPN